MIPRRGKGKGRPPRKDGYKSSYEARFATEVLEPEMAAGRVIWWAYEPWSLKLAPNKCRYTPDFAVMYESGDIVVYEVKGRWMEAAKVRLKVASAEHPFAFIAAYPRPQKDGGGWVYEEF
jgi:hypothetical protein